MCMSMYPCMYVSVTWTIPKLVAPPVSERFCVQNWLTEGARFNPRSHLSTQSCGVFHGFLRNSPKYGLGSLRKISTDYTPPVGPDPTNGQFALKPTKTKPKICILWLPQNFFCINLINLNSTFILCHSIQWMFQKIYILSYTLSLTKIHS